MSSADEVFISYCRETAAAPAAALAQALADRGIGAFVDMEAIPPGGAFPRHLADALLMARVVVIFADQAYFRSTWCLHEFRVAIAGNRAGRPDLDRVVIALPRQGEVQSVLARLPPSLAEASWPRAGSTESLAALVTERLAGHPLPLGARLGSLADEAADMLRDGGLVPAAGLAHRKQVAPAGLPASLKERFVGRERSLWEIFSALETRGAGEAKRSCLIQGAAGMGKSQLAAEYAARYGPLHYPGGVVWLDAGCDEQELQQQLHRIGQARLDPDAASVLWVVDDVPEPEPDRPPEPVSHYCPVKDRVSLLVTSRRRVQGLDTVLPLTGLDPEAAVELLTRPPADGAALDPFQWREIVDWLGAWPLGLHILNTSLAGGFVSAASVLASARADEPAAVLESEVAALQGEIEPGYLRGVAEVFRTSRESLALQPAALRLAHCIARLSTAPVGEAFLRLLGPEAGLGILAQRSLIAPAVLGNGRGWTMHRVAASYLRGVSRDARLEWLALLEAFNRWFDATRPWDDVEPAQRHFRVASLGLGRWLDETRDDDVRRSAAPLALRLALLRLDEDAARGLRYMAAEWSERLGIGNELGRQMMALFENVGPQRRRRLLHAAAGLHRSESAAHLFLHGLRDPDPPVREAARTQSTFSERSDLLAAPLVDAFLDDPGVEPRQIDFGYAPTRSALDASITRIAERLGGATPPQRTLLARMLGRILRLHRGTVQTARWTTVHLIGQLGHLALNDPDAAVREAAAQALGQWENPGTHEALVRAMEQAADDTAWRRAAEAAARYAHTVEAPPLPEVGMVEHDGSLTVVIRATTSARRRPDLYAPLVQAALESADGARRAAALAIVLGESSARICLAMAMTDALKAGRIEPALATADETIRQAPDFADGYWWRGLARQGLGQTEGALADFRRVAELAPEFAAARCRVEELQGAPPARVTPP